MLIKMFAVGLLNYFKGGAFNIFDSLIVAASIVDIIMSNVFIARQAGQSSTSAITALRGFRLLRIFKLAKQWKRFELLLETLGRTLRDVATFSILLFIIILVFSLLGLELFAYKVKFSGEEVDIDNGTSPNFNFNTFFNSFTTIFVVLTNDLQNDIYFNLYRTVGPAQASLFIFGMVVIG